MKTLWNGSLELGELAIPVGLAATVRDGGERLRRLHEVCASPVRLRAWCDRDEQLVDEPQLVHAWEVAPGEHVVLTPEERAALEPVDSRRIPLGCFVDAGELDPLLARKRYQLVPSKTTVGRRAYALVADAVHELGVAGLTRFVAWRSEQLAAITSSDGLLLQLTTLHFAEDLADRPDLEHVEDLADRLRELTFELVTRHTRRLKAGDLDSLDRPRIRMLLEAKLAGSPIVRTVVQEDERSPLPSLDLEATLERSLKQAPRRRRRKPAAAAR